MLSFSYFCNLHETAACSQWGDLCFSVGWILARSQSPEEEPWNSIANCSPEETLHFKYIAISHSNKRYPGKDYFIKAILVQMHNFQNIIPL